MNTCRHTASGQAGTSLIEVLVTMIILMIGLLGVAGLMVQSQRSEMESYQRVQALLLLQDMVGRINVNRGVAFNLTNSCYATSLPPPLGTAGNVPDCPLAASVTQQQVDQAVADMTVWSALLNGAAETSAAGGNVGAMIGARGCINYDVTTELLNPSGLPIPGTGIYTVEVAWQGIGDTFAPPATLTCGLNQYGAETRRRDISLTLRLASINNTL